jgi:uncharacterized protein YfaS (alpha-2-macroglobulin family)
LITDAALVLKSSAKQALVYFCDAITGAPIANANVALWETYYVNDKWRSRRQVKTTNSEGLAPFQLKNIATTRNLYATAATGGPARDRQAFAAGNANDYTGPNDSWRIYAYTDRPAYRPRKLSSGNSRRVVLVTEFTQRRPTR